MLTIAPASYRSGLTQNQISGILADSARLLGQAEVNLRPMVSSQAGSLRGDLDRLWRQQRSLEGMLHGDQNLGLIVPIIIGVGAGLSALGAWAWKHHSQAKVAEEKSEAFKNLKETGMDAKKAAELAYGRNGGEDVMNKAILIAAILGGIYVFSKIA